MRRDRRQDARPGLVKMYRVPPVRAWWLAVGPRLDRMVRPHLRRPRTAVSLGAHGEPLWLQVRTLADRSLFLALHQEGVGPSSQHEHVANRNYCSHGLVVPVEKRIPLRANATGFLVARINYCCAALDEVGGLAVRSWYGLRRCTAGCGASRDDRNQ